MHEHFAPAFASRFRRRLEYVHFHWLVSRSRDVDVVVVAEGQLPVVDVSVDDYDIGVVQPLHGGLMAQDDLVVEVYRPHEGLLEPQGISLGVRESVVVAVDEVFVSVKGGDPFPELVKRGEADVSKDIHHVVLLHRVVPVADDEGVMLLHRLELGPLELDYPFVVQVQVCRYVYCHSVFSFLEIKFRLFADSLHELGVQVVFEPGLLDLDSAHVHRGV